MSDDRGGWVTRRTGLVPSTAPSTRLGATSVLSEHDRPTAPEPDDDVRFTRRGLSAGHHLIAVHDHYRAELAKVREILRRVRDGGTGIGQARGELNGLALRTVDWRLHGACQAQCASLTQHHGMETEQVFPHLRRSQRDLAEVLDRLTEEHHAIHTVLEGVDGALIRLADDPTDFGPITEAVDLLTDTVLSHFAYEERELVAPLSRHGFFPGQL
ncbi:hemerythrin domain-containing protein [Umezawaea sp.]|uniref:hemerythrin domain-containing protein n=1 Tax=Umezawaea sp. TaxID=1955258 RepID=UPI002ED25AED